MSMSGDNWIWPVNKDVCWYLESEVIEKIEVPKLLNNSSSVYLVPGIIKRRKKRLRRNLDVSSYNNKPK